MKHVWNIVRKELDKIFKSPRLIFSTFFMPGLLIFIIYSVMGSSMQNVVDKKQEHTSIINTINEPLSFGSAIDDYELMASSLQLPSLNITVNKNETEINDLQGLINKTISEETVDIWIIFEKDFDNLVTKFLNKEITEPPKIMIYYNSTIGNSSIAQTKAQTILAGMEQEINPKVINTFPFDIATKAETTNSFIAMMLPMLITIFVFAGGLSVGSDAIAGEKERGTIATLLMAPIMKSQIVLGKIIATIIITILSALGSFIGVMASFPNAKALFGDGVEISYGMAEYSQILVIIALIALMASSFFLIASTIAKTTKEATMYATPVYLVAMVVSYMTMFDDKIPSTVGPYLIPIYNLVLGLKGIFLNQIQVTHFLLITGSTLVYAIVLLTFVRYLFRSEKLMFQK